MLAITVFIWGTQDDMRVRETHDERQGHSFYMDGTPADNFTPSDGKTIVPKQEINCRCYRIIADTLFISALIRRYLGGRN